MLLAIKRTDAEFKNLGTERCSLVILFWESHNVIRDLYTVLMGLMRQIGCAR